MSCVIWLLIVLNHAFTTFANNELPQKSFWSDVNSIHEDDYEVIDSSSREHFRDERHIKFHCKHFMWNGLYIYCDEERSFPFRTKTSKYAREDVENVTCLNCSNWEPIEKALRKEFLWVPNEVDKHCYHPEEVKIHMGCQCSTCSAWRRHPGKCAK